MSHQPSFGGSGGGGDVQDGRVFAALPGQGGSSSSSRRSTNPDGFRAPDFSNLQAINRQDVAGTPSEQLVANAYSLDGNRGTAQPPATAPHSPVDNRRSATFSAAPATHLASTSTSAAPPKGLLPAFNDGPMSAPPVSAPPSSADYSWFPPVPKSTQGPPSISTTAAGSGIAMSMPPQSSDQPFVFGAGGSSSSSTTSPLLTLSQMSEMSSAPPPSAHNPRVSPTQRRRISGATRQKPHLTSIDTSPGGPHHMRAESTALNSAGPSNGQSSVGGGGPGGMPRPLAPNQVGALLDQVFNLASTARDLFHKGDQGSTSMCLEELSRSLDMLGDLRGRHHKTDRDAQQGDGQISTGAFSGVPAQASASGTGSAHHRTNSETTNATNAFSMISLPPESPGIRKRVTNPMDDMPMKTMRGHQGVPVDAPAPPPSAPPAMSDNLQAPRYEPPRSAPPPLQQTNSAPLVPQLKNLGPSPLGPGQLQSQGWHDPGAGTNGGSGNNDGLTAASMGNNTSPLVQQSISSFNSASGSSASLNSAALVGVPAHSLPTSPRALPAHSRTRSVLDGAFNGLDSLAASPVISQQGAGADDDDNSHHWPADSGAASPQDAWSPSQDFDENFFGFTQAQHAFAPSLLSGDIDSKDGGGSDDQQAHVMTLKGTIDVPDMPGRGPIPTLPNDLQEKLDALFYRYLRWVCSTNDCTDANGEGIHQTLMPKRMSRLNHSEDFRPFKFRIQAFVNRWQEEVYKSGISEEQCSHKRLRQYLWTQPYISRFNEDGRKAKSKGNHVWIVEGRKLSDEEWEFQRFERKIVGPPDRTAHRGVPWSWTLRVWDPQMSAASIKPTFTIKSKPDWLSFNSDEDGAEKTLSGTPLDSSNGGLVKVSAQCLRGNGAIQNLEMSFDLTLGPGGDDRGAMMPPQRPHASASQQHQQQQQQQQHHQSHSGMASGLGLGVPLMDHQHRLQASMPMHVASSSAAFAPTMVPSGMCPPPVPSLGNMGSTMGQVAQQSSMPPPMPTHHQHLVASHHQQQPQQHSQHQQTEKSGFFNHIGYNFTHPDPPPLVTPQPPPYLTDYNGDSPMLPVYHQHQHQLGPTSQPVGMDNGGTTMPGSGHAAGHMGLPASFMPNHSAQPVAQGTPAPPLASQSLEPHDQIQRSQVRAMIEKMQRDQTASLSLKLPSERRNSKTATSPYEVGSVGQDGGGDGGHMQAQADQQQRIQQHHMELQQQQQAQAYAQAVPMPPPGQPLQLPILSSGHDSGQDGHGGNVSGIINDQPSAAGTPFAAANPTPHSNLNEAVFSAAGLSASGTPNLLSPAGGEGVEVNPFSEISFDSVPPPPHMTG